MLHVPTYDIDKQQFLNELIPPPRYKSCRFNTYFPDQNYPSQNETVRLLEMVIDRLNIFSDAGVVKKYFLRRKSDIRGLYLDGGFGIGKTHLLTSAYHQFTGKKLYLSFSELMYILSFYGMDEMVRYVEDVDLICIDEFELDDPGNTMKASNFINEIIASDTFLITTSNTVPGELGKGRFNTKDFEREIGRIASLFKKISIDGKDYRQKDSVEDDYILFFEERPSGAFEIDFMELNKHLEKLPQLFYKLYVLEKKRWYISGLKTFKLQDNALRFTHFIDKLYDSNISLSLSAEDECVELFTSEFLEGSYQKKYKRCLSRLHQLTKK